jgi:hypothetical protein
MGQIIRLPLPTREYPDDVTTLCPAETVLLLAVRWWVSDVRHRIDPLPRLCQAMHSAGAHDAAFAVDQLMAVLVRSARRPMEFHSPRCPGLSRDERDVLGAAGLAQSGEQQMAERALRAALLSAPGAEFALGSLQGLGDLFAGARLFFRRRRPPETDTVMAAPTAVAPLEPIRCRPGKR